MEDGSVYRSKRFNAVGFFLVGIRVWQWTSSFFVYACFSLLYAHIHENRLGANNRMKGVQVLGLVSLVYSTLIICFVHVSKTLGQRSWRIFAVVSVPGDLTIMGICLAKITILSYSGLPADCHGLTKENYDGSDLVRQPINGYDTIRFGSWNVETAGELDELCTFPRTVYGLSVVAIFSYTFSILLSTLYLQQQSEAVESEKTIPQLASISRSRSFDAERMPIQSQHVLTIHQDAISRTPFSAGTASLEVRSTASSSPLITTASRGGSFPPSIPIPPPWSQMSIASANSSLNSSTVSSYNQSVSTWISSVPSSDAETRSLDSEPVIPGPSAPQHCVFDYPGLLPRRCSISTNSSGNAIVSATPIAGSSESDPPAYSSRPGSLYQESMKYEAGLPLVRTPAP